MNKIGAICKTATWNWQQQEISSWGGIWTPTYFKHFYLDECGIEVHPDPTTFVLDIDTMKET